MQPLSFCDTTPLFRPLLAELLRVLRSLQPEEWERRTVAPHWRVRDIVAHLVDGDLRKIAVYRDDHALPLDGPVHDERDLARFINGLNASGVAYAQRLSPRLLTDLVELTGTWVIDVIEALRPYDRARFPVSWAGESVSENWMDIGREYTERWHHQAQIRDAVGVPRLLEPRWLEPFLDISVRVLPQAYAPIDAPAGSRVTLTVDGDTSASWTLERTTGRWALFRGHPSASSTVVRVGADDAWRLFYNALTPEAIDRRVTVEGDRMLAEPLLRARSVIL